MSIDLSSAFSAVLLAGGKSSRMGRDKAALVIDGQPLWQRQLATLRALDPVELFISGRRDGPYLDAGIEVIFDETPDLGPLGGIATALRHAITPLLLVLAVDLPDIRQDFLRALIGNARKARSGAVPWIGRRFEPLAAVYPREALSLVEECLAGEDRSLQYFARQACRNGLLFPLYLDPTRMAMFRNLNRPEDLA